MDYYCKECDKKLEKTDIRRSTTERQIQPLTRDMIYNNIIHLKNCKCGKDRNIPLAPEVEPYLDEAIGIENQNLFASGEADDTLEFWIEYEGYR